ncbi:MAG TPA: TMEM175 family protein [Xanthobacteraceae bacterium]|nr:TMEM175 family protein [Xanthobacteraceae bacterium]
MEKDRLLAFSDGVIAIIITIMVLELKAPHGADWSDLVKLAPGFLSYVLSFTFIAIYWNNHHHLLYTATRVNGTILWANTHLLFWLSLIPFATAWAGENQFAPVPTAVYGVAFLMPGCAYYLLKEAIIHFEGPESTLARATGRDLKGKGSLVLYAVGIGLAFIAPWLAMACYVAVAVVWFIPERRIEKALAQ